jgi:two-component system, cell cycle response regulator DivK
VRRRILLVEDNELNRDMLSRRLSRANFDVLIAVDGEQAVLVAREVRPDLILMDLSLPKLNGWDAATLIKRESPKLPIIALTAHAMDGDRKKALDAGCDDYDTKPVELTRLLEKINALLTSS